MEYNIYCVKDEKKTMAPYGAIMLSENDAEAMRGFAHEVGKSDNIWHTHSSDFSLWCVGIYDMSTGEITKDLRKVCDASQFV